MKKILLLSSVLLSSVLCSSVYEISANENSESSVGYCIVNEQGNLICFDEDGNQIPEISTYGYNTGKI